MAIVNYKRGVTRDNRSSSNEVPAQRSNKSEVSCSPSPKDQSNAKLQPGIQDESPQSPQKSKTGDDADTAATPTPRRLTLPGKQERYRLTPSRTRGAIHNPHSPYYKPPIRVTGAITTKQMDRSPKYLRQASVDVDESVSSSRILQLKPSSNSRSAIKKASEVLPQILKEDQTSPNEAEVNVADTVCEQNILTANRRTKQTAIGERPSKLVHRLPKIPQSPEILTHFASEADYLAADSKTLDCIRQQRGLPPCRDREELARRLYRIDVTKDCLKRMDYRKVNRDELFRECRRLGLATDCLLSKDRYIQHLLIDHLAKAKMKGEKTTEKEIEAKLRSISEVTGKRLQPQETTPKSMRSLARLASLKAYMDLDDDSIENMLRERRMTVFGPRRGRAEALFRDDFINKCLETRQYNEVKYHQLFQEYSRRGLGISRGMEDRWYIQKLREDDEERDAIVREQQTTHETEQVKLPPKMSKRTVAPKPEPMKPSTPPAAEAAAASNHIEDVSMDGAHQPNFKKRARERYSEDLPGEKTQAQGTRQIKRIKTRNNASFLLPNRQSEGLLQKVPGKKATGIEADSHSLRSAQNLSSHSIFPP